MKEFAIILLVLLLILSGGYIGRVHYIEIPQIKENTFEEGKILGDSIGFARGFPAGKILGDSIGFVRGHLKGALDMETSVVLALNGSEYIFIDEQMKSHVPYQNIVDNIFDKKNLDDKSIDLMYNGMIEGLADFISLNVTDRRTLKYNYNFQKTKMISTFKSNYNQELLSQNLRYSDEDYERVKAYTDVMANMICSVIDLLTMPQKNLLFNRAVAKGRVSSPRVMSERIVNKHQQNIDSYLEEQLKDEIVSSICSNIISNSIHFLVSAFMDYANVRSFSEHLVIGDIQNSSARKVVTEESLVPVNMGKIFSARRVFGRTAVNYSAKARVLAGVNLEKVYNIKFIPPPFSGDDKTKIVITLPKPEIIAVDVNSEFDIVNRGIYTGLKDVEINYINALAKEEGEKNAIKAGILKQAKREAEKTFKEFYYPIIDQAVGKYEILVEFKEDKFLN